MSEYTDAHFIIAHTHLRDQLIGRHRDSTENELAAVNEKLDKMSHQERANILAGKEHWNAGEEKHAEKYKLENDPFQPQNSGGARDFQEYTPLSLSESYGALRVAIQHAFTTGDTAFGYLNIPTTHSKLRYEVICTTYDPNGISLESFLGAAESNGGNYTASVTREEPAPSPITGLLHPKKGTCTITLSKVGSSDASASDSPQYDDGKERVPVHYRV